MQDSELTIAVDSLALADAVRLLTGASRFELWGEESIGLAPMVLSDGPTGVRGTQFSGGRIVTLLPNATLLASSWDEAAAERVGAILAEEARALGVHVVLGPTVNLHRTPLGGRLFEAFSEDPLLTGRLAAAYVRGLQSAGVGASVKHFVANEAESERRTVNNVVSDRALREIYLLPFEITVQDANPWTVMAAYNSVNGIPATEHDELINGILKGEWAWDGLLVSDWSATKSTAPSANGGLDLVMPGPDGPWGDALVAAVENGDVSEDVVREHLLRLLRLADRVGILGAKAVSAADIPAPHSDTRRSQMRELAAAGITLLRNEHDVVPLSPGKIALIGRPAVRTVAQGAGAAQVRPPHIVSVADGLIEALGPENLSIHQGVGVRIRPETADLQFVRDPETGEPGVRVISRDAAGAELASTSIEDGEILIDPSDPHYAAASIELSAKLNLVGPLKVLVGVKGVGAFTVDLGDVVHRGALTPDDDSNEAAVLRPPTWTTEITADASTRITVRLERGAEPVGFVGLIAAPSPLDDDEAITEAVSAATDASVAVVVVGLTGEQETEGGDKTTLALPGRQDELVTAVAAAARRTVVVVNAATPVLMPWLHQVDAVLWAGLPGQEGGHAIADVLLGKTEPTGRLVTTFPSRDADGPAWSPVPIEGTLDYADDVAVGYRGWTGEPLFWFGHGLGWTTWSYSPLRHWMTHGEEFVAVDVTNSGTRTGREVVQVYLRPDDDPVRLVGWVCVDAVAPGETRTVTVTLDSRAMRVWDDAAPGWRPITGGELLVARGLGDVRSQGLRQ